MTREKLPKILIVDDKPQNLLALSDILEDVEAEVVEAHSGNEALALVTQHEMALVLLDVHMPEMDGFEVATLMRQINTTKHIPIIFVTAHDESAEMTFKGYEAGAVDYIHKPIAPEILKSKARVFIKLYGQTRQLELKKQLEVKNEELEAFATIAAHDLRAPLRKARMFCETLKKRNEDTFDDKSRHACDRIVANMIQMTQLVDDLLDYARAGQHHVALEPVPLNDIADRVLSSLAVDIEEAGARVVVGTLPTVLGDQTGLTQLLQNLVENAIKFRDERPPVVEVFAERHDTMCQVSVKDNGIGIKPDLHEKIFTAFKRVHIASEYPGTGLGLATCAKVVERLGGRIWVESEPGEGTTFHFTLQTVKSKSSQGDGRSVERSSRRRRKHTIQAHPDR